MNCTTCQSLLVEFVYDELDEKTHAAVAAALENCAECQAELAGLRQTMQVFDNLEPLEVPAKLHNDILRTARLAAAESAPRRSWWTAIVASPAFAVAFSGLIFAGGGLAFYELTYGQEDSYPSAAVELDSVAVAAPSDERQSPEFGGDEEMQFAEELADSPTPPSEEPAPPTERVVEGRHSLDEAGQVVQAQAELENTGALRAEDRMGGEARELNDSAELARPTEGTVSGASSSGSTPLRQGAPLQRGSSRDESAIGNMMATPTTSAPAPARAAAPEATQQQEAGRGESGLALGGNFRSSSGRREQNSRSSRTNDIRPEANDPHAPGSRATVNEARGGLPSPDPAVLVAAPEPTEAPAAATGFSGSDSEGSEDQEEVYAERDEAEDHDDSAAYAFANQDSADNVPTEMDEVAAAPVRALSSEQTERLASSTELSLDGDYTEGIDFYDDGRWGRANRTLRRFLEVADPSDSRRAVARYLVGASYHQQGQYENAERELTRFLEGYPEHEYADEALVLLEDIQLRTSPANRRYAPAPAPALDAMEAEPR